MKGKPDEDASDPALRDNFDNALECVRRLAVNRLDRVGADPQRIGGCQPDPGVAEVDGEDVGIRIRHGIGMMRNPTHLSKSVMGRNSCFEMPRHAVSCPHELESC